MEKVNRDSSVYEIRYYLKQEIQNIFGRKKFEDLTDEEILKIKQIYSKANDILMERKEIKELELDSLKDQILNKIGKKQ